MLDRRCVSLFYVNLSFLLIVPHSLVYKLLSEREDKRKTEIRKIT